MPIAVPIRGTTTRSERSSARGGRRIFAHDPRLDLPPRATPDLAVATVLGSSVLVPAGVLVFEGDAGRAVELNRPVTSIGRRSDRDIVLDDVKASRRHAEVRVIDGTFTLVDCGSTNGTRVNGRRIREHALCPGDEIQIGDTRIRFDLHPR